MSFREPALISRLEAMSAADIDGLDFGVIGFDADERVEIYNSYEAATSGLDPDRVIGRHFFTEVAPCTNNYLVAERFRDDAELDEELDYVFTLRMRPTPVRIRMLAQPGASRRYLAVERRT